MSAAAYFSQLLALQPPGIALPADPASVWGRLLAAMADGFERVDARSEDLIRESDPRSSVELLPDWERVCDIPSECATEDAANTLQVRRAAVVNVLTRVGGQSPSYYIKLAHLAGLAIDITEYRPFLAGLSRCGEPLSGPEDVRFCWTVTVHGKRVTRFRSGESACGDRLSDFDPAKEVECLLRRAKPAHTVLVVGYDFPRNL